ncbi:phage tail tape measure protein [Roseospira goensis]|uniref:TP901 family phage tail tape measure protein n=1 Tax=Roseospira goensis TaxID=391922 RepID=A0A7W6S2H9_9PROT|nr:phage tail tape measure protein [Roseospira goensis]MBB4287644.1 TP901 family phage tail tape measure protein [Roseospira goensis]
MSSDLNLALTIRLMDRATAPLRGIGQAMRGFGRQTRDLSGDLDRLKQQQGAITAFRQLKERLDQAGTAMTAAKTRAEGLGRELGQTRRRADALRGELTAAEAEVDRLGREMAATEAPTEEMAAAFKAAEARAEALRTELSRTDDAAEKLDARLGDARVAARRAADGHRTLAERTERARRELRDLDLSADRLADAQRRVTRETRAATEALARQADQAAAAQRRTEALARARERMQRTALAAAGVGAAGYGMMHAGRVGLGWVKPAMEADHAWTALGLVAGATADELDHMRDRVRDIAAATNQDATALREALGFLIGKGLSPGDALAVLDRVGRAATATGADMADMGALTFAAMDTLLVAAGDVGRAHDIMARAGDLGGFELRDMARTFPQLTANARALGLTGTKAIATLSAALQVAVKGASGPEDAATNLANFLQKATAPETVRNFEKFGIDIKAALREAVLRGENPFDALLAQIAQATGADLEQEMSKAIAAGADPRMAADALARKFELGELFGDMQVLNFLAPMLANMEEFRRIRAEALGADGVVDRKFAIMRNTDEERWKALLIAADALKETTGGALSPALGQVADAMTRVVRGTIKWTEKNPELVASLGTVAAWTAAGAVGIGGLMTAAGAVLVPLAVLRWSMTTLGLKAGLLGTAMRGVAAAGPLVAGAFRVMSAALVATPIGWVLLLAAALAGIVYAIYRNWDGIGEWFQGKWDRIKAAFDDGLLNGILALLEEFNPVTLLAEAINGMIDWLFGVDLFEIGKAWMDQLRAGFAAVLDDIKAWFGRRIADIVGILPDWLQEHLGVDPAKTATDDTPPVPRDRRGRRILPGSVAAAALGTSLAAGGAAAAAAAAPDTLGRDPAAIAAAFGPPASAASAGAPVADPFATHALLDRLGAAGDGVAAAAPPPVDVPVIPAVPAGGPPPAQPVVTINEGDRDETRSVSIVNHNTITVPPGTDVQGLARAMAAELARQQRGALHDLD